MKNTNNKAKVLLIDIETSPMTVYSWGLFDQNIGLNQVKEDSYIISWAAKWLDSPENEVYYMDQRNAKDLSKNKKMLQELRNLLDEADIVVGQNSVRFDVKRLNAEFTLNDIEKPSSYRQQDTLKIAKKHFLLPSYKLEYMTKRFCKKHKKSDHKKFIGFDLWRQCLAGNKEAWQEMEKYNKKDVLALEEIYNIFKTWDSSIDFSVFDDEPNGKLCSCGSRKFKKNGFRYTNSSKYQRYKCVECYRESSGKVNLHSKEKRQSLRN